MATYKNRKMITNTVSHDTLNMLEELHEKTLIPKSRILDMSIKMFYEKFKDGYLNENKGE